MSRHETPPEVASALAQWAPNSIATLLDPCVGAGALLSPFFREAQMTLERVVGIDQDQSALDLVSSKFGAVPGQTLSLICCDFLQWEKPKELFDCVVMNPPFAARRKIVSQVLTGKRGRECKTVYAPTEAAFLLKAIGMVKPRGRLLAILPGSVISGKSGVPIRRHLLRCGRVLCVHELANFTFPGVESRVYLLAFERAARQGAIRLCNQRLDEPTNLALPSHRLGNELRLDFGYHHAAACYGAVQAATPGAGWAKLSALATIKRGAASTSQQVTAAAHSTDYREGFWDLKQFGRSGKSSFLEGVCPSDLLIRRVGRCCASSLGLVTGGAPAWTDCVLRIRPKKWDDIARLLFGVRVLFTADWGRQLVERGSGATYISATDLGEILVPSLLWRLQPASFGAYKAAVAKHQFQRMLQLERTAGQLMGKRVAA